MLRNPAETGSRADQLLTAALLAEAVAVCVLALGHPVLVVVAATIGWSMFWFLERPAARARIAKVWRSRWRSWWIRRPRLRDVGYAIVLTAAFKTAATFEVGLFDGGAGKAGDNTLDDLGAAVAGDKGLATQLTWILLVVAIGPLVEELVFRGYALRLLVDAIGRTRVAAAAMPLAVAATVTCFAAMHTHLSVAGMVSVGISGLGFTLVALRGGVGLSWFGHALSNAVWVALVIAW